MLRLPGAAGVVFQESKVEGVVHGDGSSELCCADGVRVPAAMVLDATGHSRKLVQFDAPFDPGYQVGSVLWLVSYLLLPHSDSCARHVASAYGILLQRWRAPYPNKQVVSTAVLGRVRMASW